MLIKPSLSSIWLAEDIIDEDNGRTTLRGVFNQIALTSENGEYESPFSVLFAVSDVRRRCRCELRLSDLADLSIIYRRAVDSRDRVDLGGARLHLACQSLTHFPSGRLRVGTLPRRRVPRIDTNDCGSSILTLLGVRNGEPADDAYPRFQEDLPG